MTVCQTLIGFLFPFFLNYGFCSCAGIYVLTPISEREIKTRSILNMMGMKSSSYWIGLFLADYTIFLMPVACFMVFIYASHIMAFSDHMGAFLLVMAAFGGGLIANIYFIQHFYIDQNAAVR